MKICIFVPVIIATATMTKAKKIFTWIIVILILGLSIFCYFSYFYVFSEGVKTGELNQISRKGYVFKTYEGVIILTGYGSNRNTNGVQSKEFNFSAKKDVAEDLANLTGQKVTVHYKKYFKALPWRGYQCSIVDKVERNEAPDEGHGYSDDGLFL